MTFFCSTVCSTVLVEQILVLFFVKNIFRKCSLREPFFLFYFWRTFSHFVPTKNKTRICSTKTGLKMFSDPENILEFGRFDSNFFGKMIIRGIRSWIFVWNFQIIDTGDWLIRLGTWIVHRQRKISVLWTKGNVEKW